MFRAILILALLSVSASAETLNRDRLLVALRAVEDFRGQDGAAGERGSFQIMEVTWRQHMPGRPFTEARQAGPSLVCTLRHIAWLSAALEAAGVPAAAFNVALAWNAGLDRTLRGRAPVSSYLYAGRVRNLYDSNR